MSRIDLSKMDPSVNVSELLHQMGDVQNRLTGFEDTLKTAGIVDVKIIENDISAFIGHRLEIAEQKLAELQGVDEVLLPMDAAWVISCATLVFLMQLGFAMLEAGMCRPKNVVATYVKNIIDFVLGTICTLLIGFALAYGQTPLFDEIDAWKFFFHLVFQAAASTIVSGAMAERINIKAYIIITTFLSGIVYAMSVRWTWGGGFLSRLDPPFHDFGGAGIVHLLGGSAALAGTQVLGARSGRWEFPEKFQCHSVPQVLSGVLLLWVGWYGFNPGSTGAMSSVSDALYASNAAMTTTISAATAGSVALVTDLIRHNFGYIDVLAFANAVLGGLVAITAGANVLNAWTAIITGAVSVYVYKAVFAKVESLGIDDVVDASAVHGGCGAWGCLAVGLFHPQRGAFFGGGASLLLTQIFGVVSIACLGCVPMYILCRLLNMKSVNMLRCSSEEERIGIDLHLFKVSAYSYLKYENDDDLDSLLPLKGAPPTEKADEESAASLTLVPTHANAPTSFPSCVAYLREQFNLPPETAVASVVEKAVDELDLLAQLKGKKMLVQAYACYRFMRAAAPLEQPDTLTPHKATPTASFSGGHATNGATNGAVANNVPQQSPPRSSQPTCSPQSKPTNSQPTFMEKARTALGSSSGRGVKPEMQ